MFNASHNFAYPVQMHHTTGVLEPRSHLVLQILSGVGTVLFKNFPDSAMFNESRVATWFQNIFS